MFEKQELDDFLADNAEEIKAHVKQRMIEKLLETHNWEISDQVRKSVAKFMAEEVIPEVEKELAAQKGPIMQACLTAASGACQELAQGLVKDVAEKLASSYNRKKVYGALFDPY